MKWFVALACFAINSFAVLASKNFQFEKHHHHHSSKMMKSNQAQLIIESEIESFNVFLLSSECYKCEPGFMCTYEKSLDNCKSLYVDTTWPMTVTIKHDNPQSSCSIKQLFGTQGIYHLLVNQTSSKKLSCKTVTVKEPENIYLPILTAFSVIIGLMIVVHVVLFLNQKGIFNKIFQIWKAATYAHLTESQESNREGSMESNKLPIKIQKRLHSLDVFRGLSLTIMIFVNYGGGNYWFFKHSAWNGLTVADLVFPWFMWIMGVSTTFSLKGLLRRCLPRWLILLKIFKRSFILFALGIMLNSLGKTNLSTLRIPGVLQRFGIAYFVVSSVELFFSKAGDVTQPHWYSIGDTVKDKAKYFLEWLIILLFPLVHCLVTFLLYVPGCPKGFLQPGGYYMKTSAYEYANCTGGAAGYIDRLVFGEKHLYQSPTCQNVYDTVIPYDPEGLLGCLTSIFLVFLGVKAGKILIMHQNKRIIIGWWIWWGVVTGIIAGVLCNFSRERGWIPVNKNLWSLSFVLCMASFAFFLLTFLYIVVDIQSWWSGAPFTYPGMNSILVYVGSEITGKMFPWTWATGISHWENLFCDLWGAFLWVLISMWLYWHKFFLAI